jgi:hypothetical protein
MSRRTVMATLKAGKGDDSYRARYPSPQMSHIGTGALLGAQSRVYANGSSSSVGSVLIDKIAEISSTATKYTTIECTATYGVVPVERSGRAGRQDESQLIISNFSLFIDWDQGTVVYQGKYTFPGDSAGSTEWQFYNGTSSISEAGGSVTMSATNDHMGSGQRSAVPPVLKYNINRHVTGVPVIDGPSHLMGYFSLHSYTITTDDGINVTAAPTPAPAETPEVAAVVGVKISELNAVDALQHDDLFVLSQDNTADGTYDASYNVTLSKMRGRAVLFDGTNGLNVVNIMNLDSNETLTSNQLDFNLTMGTTNTVPNGFGGTKTVDLSSVPATARNILVFASIDSSENEYCSWKYKHPSGSSWIYYIRSQDNGGYPNSNNSAVPLESGGKVDFQFNSSSAFGPLHSLDLHIVGYEL